MTNIEKIKNKQLEAKIDFEAAGKIFEASIDKIKDRIENEKYSEYDEWEKSKEKKENK